MSTAVRRGPPRLDIALEDRIQYYVRRGYRVVNRTETTAQLLRPKTFSFVWASFWFIFGLGFGIFFYLFYYLAKQDSTLYLPPTLPNEFES